MNKRQAKKVITKVLLDNGNYKESTWLAALKKLRRLDPAISQAVWSMAKR